jgi:hypothetical protein
MGRVVAAEADEAAVYLAELAYFVAVFCLLASCSEEEWLSRRYPLPGGDDDQEADGQQWSEKPPPSAGGSPLGARRLGRAAATAAKAAVARRVRNCIFAAMI